MEEQARPRARGRRVWAAGVLALAIVTAVGVTRACLQARDVERDKWQRPEEVMDAMGVHAGSQAADVGAGEGYFTMHLARRVGPAGKVYAVDISQSDLKRIEERAKEEGFANVVTVRGETNDPKLPEVELDGVVTINAYHEFREYDAMMRGVWRALKPGGRWVILDREATAGKPRSEYYSGHRIPEELVKEDAERNGFRFVEERERIHSERGVWYFVVFEK